MEKHESIIYPNVLHGQKLQLSEFVILGYGGDPENAEHKTLIGNNALLRSHTVIYFGNVIGNNFQTGHHVNIREFNIIGNNVSVGTGTVIEHHVKIGNNVRIHSQAFIPEETLIEDDAWLGPNVVITNALYPRSRNVKNELIGATIRRGAKIGANATLLPGVDIGEYALIGAGAVVTRDVAPRSVMVGNPARKINTIENLPYDL